MKLDRRMHFKILMVKNNLTPGQVAKEMGITRDSLYKKIKGVYKFNEEDIVQIMKIFNKRFDEIFIRPDNEN